MTVFMLYSNFILSMKVFIYDGTLYVTLLCPAHSLLIGLLYIYTHRSTHTHTHTHIYIYIYSHLNVIFDDNIVERHLF